MSRGGEGEGGERQVVHWFFRPLPWPFPSWGSTSWFLRPALGWDLKTRAVCFASCVGASCL